MRYRQVSRECLLSSRQFHVSLVCSRLLKILAPCLGINVLHVLTLPVSCLSFCSVHCRVYFTHSFNYRILITTDRNKPNWIQASMVLYVNSLLSYDLLRTSSFVMFLKVMKQHQILYIIYNMTQYTVISCLFVV